MPCLQNKPTSTITCTWSLQSFKLRLYPSSNRCTWLIGPDQTFISLLLSTITTIKQTAHFHVPRNKYSDYRWRLAESTVCPLKMWSDRCLLSSCSICILVSPALLGCCLFVSLKTVRLMGWWSWVHLLIRAFLLVLVCLSSLFKLQTCLVCAAPLSAARITLCCMCVAEECGSADLDMAQRF